MTKEEFFKLINDGRYPKYVFSQIKENAPNEDCGAIVCTESGRVAYAKFENGKWQQAHFTSPDRFRKQEIYWTEIQEEVVFWTEGEAEDRSSEQ